MSDSSDASKDLKKKLNEEYGPCEYNFETGTVVKL
jgi:hypothetical protein